MVDNNARTKAARAARKQAAAKRRAEAEATGRALEPVGRVNNNVPYTENFADADKVLKAAGAAMTIKEICALIGISEPTLRRCYRAELDSGHAIAISKVANVAFQIATDVNHPKVAQMAQFWLRSRGKWQLNDNVTVTGAVERFGGQRAAQRQVAEGVALGGAFGCHRIDGRSPLRISDRAARRDRSKRDAGWP